MSSQGGAGDEASSQLLLNIKTSSSQLKHKEEDYKSKEKSRKDCKVTGSCLCKLSLVLYLLTCISLSTIYVIFFGKNQAFFGDAWIPGKPTPHHHKPSPPESPPFQDLPYTEWISQRWTYEENSFADWPTLPCEIDYIQQILAGKMSGSGGLWLLTDSQLYFVHGLHGGLTEDVNFVNISEYLEIEVSPESYLVSQLDSALLIISPDNITLLDCSQLECKITYPTSKPVPFSKVITSAISLSDSTLWLGTPEGLFTLTEESQGELSFSNISHLIGPVQTLAWRSVVTDAGHAPHHAFLLDPEVENVLQESLACSDCQGMQWTGSYWSRRGQDDSDFGLLVAGTRERIYFYDGKHWWFEWVSLREEGLGGVVDAPPTAMTFGPSGELYIANNISLIRVNINYTFDRIDGLPYHHITSLHVSPYTPVAPPPIGPTPPPSLLGTLWIGTTKGYTLFDIQRSEFRGYFYGPRWLPNGAVLSMAGSRGGVVILTDEGMAVVHPEEWTLARKALHYQDLLERHIHAPGLVGECSLVNYTPSTCEPLIGGGGGGRGSEGVWTSWVLAAEAFRYQITKDSSARENAWKLYSGLQFLVNVTDVPGLIARSVAPENSSLHGDDDGPQWHDSSAAPGWRWRGGASSQEVGGHMLAYPLVYDLVAEGEKKKREVEELLSDVIGYIKENEFELIDTYNYSVDMGVWSPQQLNLNRSWSGGRGVQSLQLLSYLVSSYSITKDNQLLRVWKDLYGGGVYEAAPTNYGRNMINQKILHYDGGYSDELSFLPYFIYHYSIKRMSSRDLEQLGPHPSRLALLSLKRTMRSAGIGRSSAWSAITAYITGDIRNKALLEDLVWSLRTWPLELIDWRTENTHRLDVTQGVQGRVQGRHEVLPANERSQLRWTGDPYLLDGGGESRELDPGPWLMPYWLARWSRML